MRGLKVDSSFIDINLLRYASLSHVSDFSSPPIHDFINC